MLRHRARSSDTAMARPLTRPAGDLSPAGRGDNQRTALESAPALGQAAALGEGLLTSLLTPPTKRPEVSPAGTSRQPLDDGSAAFVVRCACDPSPDGTGGDTVADHIRLFPLRGDVRWVYRVHEQILPALRRAGVPVKWTDLTVRHTGYVDKALRARKINRDVQTTGDVMAENGYSAAQHGGHVSEVAVVMIVPGAGRARVALIAYQPDARPRRRGVSS